MNITNLKNHLINSVDFFKFSDKYKECSYGAKKRKKNEVCRGN